MTAPAVNIKHGTYGGYQAHKKAGRPACDACKAANAAYHEGYRAGRPEARANDRYWNNTRKAALERLAVEYRARFQEILAEIRGGS